MKRFLIAASVVAATLSIPALAADVGVSVSIGQPGFYGRGTFLEETTTTPDYKLYKLNGFTPARPGLLRVTEAGATIHLEVWQLPIENYGAFVSGVPAPLGFGTLTLADGRAVNGFLCEHYATLNAIDISHLGGWRRFLKEGA